MSTKTTIMTYATKKAYQTDLAIQKMVLFPMIFFYVTIVLCYFGMMIQILVGIAQVTSGLTHALYYKDPRRQKYIAGVLCYFMTWLIPSLLPHEVQNDYIGALGFIWVFLVPTGIAIWYYRLTKKDLEAFEAKEEENYGSIEWKEELLDA